MLKGPWPSNGRGDSVLDRAADSLRKKLKWAARQEAVTFPWLSAHSIRKGIGGDTYMVNLAEGLSSIPSVPISQLKDFGRRDAGRVSSRRGESQAKRWDVRFFGSGGDEGR